MKKISLIFILGLISPLLGLCTIAILISSSAMTIWNNVFGNDNKSNLDDAALISTYHNIPTKYLYIILTTKDRFGCDEVPINIIAAQDKVESDFNPMANDGIAKGIAQFQQSTFDNLKPKPDGDGDGKIDIFDPYDNIAAQWIYMCKLTKHFKSIDIALEQYNCGCSNVDYYVKQIKTYSLIYTTSQIPSTGSDSINKVLQAAYSALGSKYVFGGSCTSSFKGENGCDCASLVQMAYKSVGIQLPSGSNAQYNVGISISDITQLQPGDLIFYKGAEKEGGTIAKPGHVTMYIGNSKMIEAPHTGDVVKIINVYDDTTNNLAIIGIRRILY